MKIKCKVCNKILTSRRNFSKFSDVPYPTYHLNNRKNICHGFFEEGIQLTDKDK